jgi:tetratricopeptide (TPR) repeat protein
VFSLALTLNSMSSPVNSKVALRTTAHTFDSAHNTVRNSRMKNGTTSGRPRRKVTSPLAAAAGAGTGAGAGSNSTIESIGNASHSKPGVFSCGPMNAELRLMEIEARSRTPIQRTAMPARRKHTPVSPNAAAAAAAGLRIDTTAPITVQTSIVSPSSRSPTNRLKPIPPSKLRSPAGKRSPVNRAVRSHGTLVSPTNRALANMPQSPPRSPASSSGLSDRKMEELQSYFTHVKLDMPLYLAPPSTFNIERRITDMRESKEASRRIKQSINEYKTRIAGCTTPNMNSAKIQSQLSLGILYDNQQKFSSAVQAYHQVLLTATQINDKTAIGIALNHMACSSSRIGSNNAMQDALHYSEHHVKFADQVGRFVAFSNLGLFHMWLEQLDKADSYLKLALKWGVQFENAAAQSIAIGHIGMLNEKRKDWVSARACMTRRLQLLQDAGITAPDAEIDTLVRLGNIAAQQQLLSDSQVFFSRANERAAEIGQHTTSAMARVSVGVAAGNMCAEEHFASLAASIGAL